MKSENSNDWKPGTITTQIEDGWDFIQSLEIISEGNALEELFSVSLNPDRKLMGFSLSSSLNIFDALLFQEQINLCLLQPKKKDLDQANKLFDNSDISKLLKNRILQQPLLPFSIEEYYKLRNKLVTTALLDRRLYTVAELDTFSYSSACRDKSVSIRKFNAELAIRRYPKPWTNPSVEFFGRPLTYDSEVCAQSLLTTTPVIKVNGNLPTAFLLNDSITHAWDFISKKLSENSPKIRKELIEEKLIRSQSSLNVPLGLSLVLERLPNNANPNRLLDTTLELRKDKSIQKLRQWLNNFSKYQRDNNFEQIARARAEVEAVSQSILQEFHTLNLTERVQAGYPNVAQDIFEDVLNILTNQPPKEIVKRFVGNIGELLQKRRLSHLFLMQKLGKRSLNPDSFKNEFYRCFGKTPKTRRIVNEISNYSAACDKIYEIEKMKPQFLRKEAVEEFVTKMNEKYES